MRSLLRAAGLGLGGALAGALLWVAARRLTGHEMGVGALAVGLFVGYAVRKGANGQGGARYQALALFLTYTGFVLNYAMDIVPLVMKTAGQGSLATVATGFGLSFGLPIVAATRNLLGMLVQAYALYEAWRLNRRPALEQSPANASAAFADSTPRS